MKPRGDNSNSSKIFRHRSSQALLFGSKDTSGLGGKRVSFMGVTHSKKSKIVSLVVSNEQSVTDTFREEEGIDLDIMS